MKISALLRYAFFGLFLCLNPVSAEEHEIHSRLIIGFDPDTYQKLGGAAEVTDYINEQWGEKKKVFLVRPMGNSAILVEVNKPDSINLNQIISKLMQMSEVLYVNEDQPVGAFPSSAPNIPSFQ